jgi:Family of unknown function (DUF5684)
MKRLLGRVVAALCFCMFLVTAGYGKQLKSVYLKDGGVIECRSFWKEDGKVVVLVNRDVLVDLPQNEVDLKRTFKSHKRAVVRKPAQTGQTKSEEKGKPGPHPAAAAHQNAASTATKPIGATVTKGPAPGSSSVQHAVPGPKPEKPGPVAAPVQRPAPRLHTTPPPNVVQTSSAVSFAAGMLSAGMLLPFLLIILILIASFWRVFTKAGEAGWQSIIPLYNLFILVKISGKPWWWFLLLFVPLVNIIIGILVQIALADKFNRGVLYGLGLAFLGFIFYPVLAFGNATYRQSDF